MNKLVYFAYHNEDCCRQARYSMLTAMRFGSAADAGYRLDVYTDRPDLFEDICTSIHVLSEQTLKSWVGPDSYFYQAKIHVLLEALTDAPAITVFVDTDTFFLKPPKLLFQRIRKGYSVMERCEGVAPQSVIDALKTVSKNCDFTGLTCIDRMWNSGVVGVHPEQRSAVKRALDICEQLYSSTKIFNVEQYALGACLESETVLQECSDIVYHYCHPSLKKSFSKQYERLNKKFAKSPLSEQVMESFKYRPKWDLTNAAKIKLKKLLKRYGLLKRKIRFELT
jgi:hypothetical protein